MVKKALKQEILQNVTVKVQNPLFFSIVQEFSQAADVFLRQVVQHSLTILGSQRVQLGFFIGICQMNNLKNEIENI